MVIRVMLSKSRRLVAVVLGALGLTGAPDSGATHISPGISIEREQLESRVIAARDALRGARAGDDPVGVVDKIAQWANWPNWGNWGNWPNWNNWANWSNG